MKLLLKDGKVIDYGTKTEDILDILIEDDKIVKVAKKIEGNFDKIVDCNGLFIMPGMIDMHCHLREPGGEHKETIETGSKSAVKGGFTSICPMPNTKPTPDSAIILEQIKKRAEEVNLCNIFPFSSVTKGEKGEELVDFKAQLDAGAIAFSDDGMPVENARMIREAIIETNKLRKFCI